MMLQFISLNIDSLILYTQNLYLQGFTQSKNISRKPCSFDCVTLGLKLIHKTNQF